MGSHRVGHDCSDLAAAAMTLRIDLVFRYTHRSGMHHQNIFRTKIEILSSYIEVEQSLLNSAFCPTVGFLLPAVNVRYKDELDQISLLRSSLSWRKKEGREERNMIYGNIVILRRIQFSHL